MYHARSTQFEPALFADFAFSCFGIALAEAVTTADVYFEGRFCKLKVMGSESRGSFLTKIGFGKEFRNAYQVGNIYVLVYDQALELMEHGIVCSICLAAICLTDIDHFDGRSLLELHLPKLAIAGMSGENDIVGNIKCFLVVSGRMIFWDI